jgi:hypothetical protein
MTVNCAPWYAFDEQGDEGGGASSGAVGVYEHAVG